MRNSFRFTIWLSIVAGTTFLVTPAFSFQIQAVFDSSITGDPNATAIKATSIP